MIFLLSSPKRSESRHNYWLSADFHEPWKNRWCQSWSKTVLNKKNTIFFIFNSIIIFYSSQVLPGMEYCSLTWCGCNPSYLHKLDSIRDRAQRLIVWKPGSEKVPITVQPLQQLRNVSAMCVFYKALQTRIEHLQCLCVMDATPFHRNLRSLKRRNEEVSVPRSRTDQHLRSFLPKNTRMWNNHVRFTIAE